MIETVLTLDLGITTGWAVFRDRILDRCGTITNHHRDIPIMLQDYLPDAVVVEKPLIMPGQLGEDLRKIISIAEYFLVGGTRDVEWIRPADWKGTPAAKESVPRGLTQHERDAIRMGYWFIRYRLQGNVLPDTLPA